MYNNFRINLENLKIKLEDTLFELLKKKDYTTAEKILEQAIKVYDEHKYYQYLTIIKQKLNKLEDNDILFEDLCKKYNNPDDWNNYSIHLKNKKMFHEAIDASNKAILMNEKKSAYYCNKAMALAELDDYEKAIEELDTAIKIDPTEWYFYANKGCCHAGLNQLEEAEKNFLKAISNKNCKKDVHVDYFYCLAYQNKYETAWQHYEKRYECFPNLIKYMQNNNLERPEKIEPDMEICVFLEQGIGDNLMFLRYIKQFQTIYKNSYFLANDNFKTICSDIRCETSFRSNKKYGISILSLPYYLKSNIIPEPYKLGNYKPRKEIKNIGIIWAGNPAHPMDYQRNFYAEDILSKIDFSKYKVFSFQKDKRPRKYNHTKEIFDYAKNFKKYDVIDLSNELVTIADTVRYMEEMDLFIGIDSLPIHIAGSVGLPTILFVSDKPDWRWGKTGDYSEWYSNIKIYRKNKTQSFENLIGSCLVDL